MFFDFISNNVIGCEPPGFFEYFCLLVGFIYIIVNIKKLISSIKNSNNKTIIIFQSVSVCIVIFLFLITYWADMTGINLIMTPSEKKRIFINNIIFNLLNCLIIPITLQIILNIKLKKEEEKNV